MKRFLAFTFAMLTVSSAHALTYNTYTDRTAFEAAVEGAAIETFDEEATGSISTSRVFTYFTADLVGSAQSEVAPGTDGTNINGTNFLKYGTCSTAASLDLTPNSTTHGIGFDWRNTDPTGDDAAMTVVVDGESFVFGTDNSSGFFGVVATDGQFSTVQFQDTGGDGGCLTSLGLDNVTLADAASDVAQFKVTKEFAGQVTDAVEVTLSCNGGLPLTQSFTIDGGDPVGVTFVVTNIPDTGADCEVTESGSPSGYTASFDNGSTVSATSCAYDGILGGARTCTITNSPKPFNFWANVTWTANADDGSDIPVDGDLSLSCTNVWDGTSLVTVSDAYAITAAGTYQLIAGTYAPDPNGDTVCNAALVVDDNSAVEVNNSACTDIEVEVGDPYFLLDEEGEPIENLGEVILCEIEATVFFEGIPTLSQYGMAIMVLLMLGVGFVGFRRFV